MTSDKTSLCEALGTIKDGKQLPIVFSGIYAENMELQIFYDPNQPLCEMDVQPSTWIEFSSSVVDETRLESLLEQDRRGYVKFKGTLVAPASTGPDNPSLPIVAAYANRVSGRRYGHLSAFRTKLIVDSVLDAKTGAGFSAVGCHLA